MARLPPLLVFRSLDGEMSEDALMLSDLPLEKVSPIMGIVTVGSLSTPTEEEEEEEEEAEAEEVVGVPVLSRLTRAPDILPMITPGK